MLPLELRNDAELLAHVPPLMVRCLREMQQALLTYGFAGACLVINEERLVHSHQAPPAWRLDAQGRLVAETGTPEDIAAWGRAMVNALHTFATITEHVAARIDASAPWTPTLPEEGRPDGD